MINPTRKNAEIWITLITLVLHKLGLAFRTYNIGSHCHSIIGKFRCNNRSLKSTNQIYGLHVFNTFLDNTPPIIPNTVPTRTVDAVEYWTHRKILTFQNKAEP